MGQRYEYLNGEGCVFIVPFKEKNTNNWEFVRMGVNTFSHSGVEDIFEDLITPTPKEFLEYVEAKFFKCKKFPTLKSANSTLKKLVKIFKEVKINFDEIGVKVMGDDIIFKYDQKLINKAIKKLDSEQKKLNKKHDIISYKRVNGKYTRDLNETQESVCKILDKKRLEYECGVKKNSMKWPFMFIYINDAKYQYFPTTGKWCAWYGKIPKKHYSSKGVLDFLEIIEVNFK